MKQKTIGGLSCWISEPSGSADGCLIVLHGIGSSGMDLLPILEEMDLSNLKVIFPNAPHAISPPARLKWYDPYGESTSGITESGQLLRDLLDEVIQSGVAPEKLVLLGFSQGGRMAMISTLNYPKTLGGCICLSGLLGSSAPSDKIQIQEGLKAPFLVMHGTQDTVVPITIGGKSVRDTLQSLGAQVQYLEYPIGHEMVSEEFQVVRKFLDGIY